MRVIYRAKFLFSALLFCTCLAAMDQKKTDKYIDYRDYMDKHSDFDPSNLSLNDNVFKNWWLNKTISNKLSISIGAEDCKALGPNWRDYIGILVKSNLGFTDLSFDGTGIPPLGYYGIGCIAEGLKVNNTLKKLDLKNCDARITGLIILSYAIKINKTLVALNLDGNRFDNNAAESFIESLKENPSLTELNLGFSPIPGRDSYISPDKLAKIEAFISRNKTLTSSKP